MSGLLFGGSETIVGECANVSSCLVHLPAFFVEAVACGPFITVHGEQLDPVYDTYDVIQSVGAGDRLWWTIDYL